jgi:uncharacterized protein (TIGR03083 family)
MNHEEHCVEFEVEVSRYVAALADAEAQRHVPSCPEWSVADLTEHLGLVHRWAQRLVATRAQERLAFPSVDMEVGPIDASWLRQGADSLCETLRDADADTAMWAWGPDQHVRFWSRRQAHETLVHRVDLELALGKDSVVDALVACDAIDEFLVNLASAARFSPQVRELRGSGEVIAFEPDDGDARWLIQLNETGFALVEQSGVPDAAMSGSSRDLLLAIYRRVRREQLNVNTSGDDALVDFWIAKSALE